uniref:Cation channel complex component UNC80 N-terminal domain-containing protein n=1 Tax=Panagrolaimus superbus TaxID=310955 RepID=A0A914YVH3_9BILA
MMPLSTAAGSVKSSRWSEKAEDDDNIECEPVPLPIQTFLWRQTNPFLGAKSYKLHEASSVTFERVVVQNILHGLSPSLSDAIASVSRWRFVRAAFPHIIQCCAALLSERVNENDPIPVSGSLAKLLYILHWLLMDAATECNESTFGDSGDGVISVRQLAFSVASIQLFVYLLAPLFYHINEEEIESHIRLESGLRLWQAFWQYRTPDILCFCAPVKQRRCQLPQVTMSKKLPAATAVEQGIYLGDENIANRRLSQVPQISVTIPPPKPPRTDLSVLREIQQKQKSKKEDLPPPPPTDPPPSESFSDDAGKSNCSIVRSVSDYKTNEVAAELQGKLNLKKSRTDVFHKSPDYSDSDIFNGLRDIDEAMKFAEDNSLSDIFHLNDKAAPLVLLQEICSAASIDNSDGKSSNGIEPICVKCGKRIVPNPLNANDKCLCKNGSVAIEIPAILATKQAENKIITNGTKLTESIPETSSSGSQQTVINMGQRKQPQPPQQHQQQQSQSPPTVLLEGTWKDSASMHSTDKPDVLIDPHEASYLDIAILRCLLIDNWAEEGVFWALKFLLNRLTDIRHYRLMHDGTFRSRSNSVPTTAPRGSRQDVLEADYLTWSDLQDRKDISNTRKSVDEQAKTDIIIDDNSKTKIDIFNKKTSNQLTVSADKRRVSVNTLPAIKKISRAEKRKLPRSKSDPLLSRALEYMEPCRGTSISENAENGDSKMIQQNFFPEATGSSLFIEKNGHIDLTVVLSVIRSLIERCGAVRILEIALNVCDTLLTMTNVDPSVFFENILKIVLRTYLHMGCPNGCNEGMRTPQADFLQIKARNLLSQLYKINPNAFIKLLKKQVSENTVQQLLDCIHAITVFCQAEMGPHRNKLNRNRRRSSTFIQHSEATRLPSYRNHFNENHSGIEGVIIDTILTPLTSKTICFTC